MNGSNKNWYLDHRTDDLRGWPVLDAKGSLIGEVTELLVDTDSGYVSTVVLLGGRKLSAHDMQIGDGVLTMLVTTEPERATARPQLASVPPEKETIKDKAKQKVEEL